ncbi:ETC complex I subunit [Magnetospira sp. QH-2]|uniref:ETC complex I subunit n=1 Tax=Magnetospira sp. (strain QH-2) TaxID=1288970 RepID=UPI0003E81A97|nr:ETC complex I subunit [Magnetospira sp. QH-2]CCQ73583.1 Putative NADH-ubiquinone oxidoreductase-related protein [Magnetospira sp. QH-2]
MTDVVIYQPAKNAMQSGRANSRQWVLEHEAEVPRSADRMVGWIGSNDTQTQVKLKFDSQDAAIAYAERNGLGYRCITPQPRKVIVKNYADKFAYNRVR